MNASVTASTDWLRVRARRSHAAVAVIAGDARITWGELDARADEAAAALVESGVVMGDRVALLAPNGPDFVVMAHAAPRAGAILVPLNTRLAARELGWQIADSGARLVVHSAGLARLASTAAASGAVPTTDAGGLRGRASRRGDDDSGHQHRVHSIIYTSGATGLPKGAMLTFANHLWSAIGSAMNLGLREDDRLLGCLPLFHVGGLAVLLRSAIYGNTAVVHETFDPARVNAAIDDGSTILSVVANMLVRMLEERGSAPYPRSLRAVLLGGGPAPRTLLETCAERGVPVIQTYGLTEAASQVTTLAPGDAFCKLGSAGKPLFPTEVRIETEGRPARPGEAGDILVRGATVSPGYWRRPEETAEVFRGGWLHTGDVGRLDEDGYLYLLDRRTDLIVSGGENVYPAEVEMVLLSHPDVAEAGVYGIDDDRWSCVPAAKVVLRRQGAVSADELVAFCAERLAKYKIPRNIEFAAALPRTAAGKLQRHRLRPQSTVTGAPGEDGDAGP
jgi:O-succinylbenzoic acid--CoA ligase